jgi:hypothetical protein
MSRFVGEVAAAVVAAVLTYVAFTLTENSNPALRWSLIGVIGLVAVCAAWLAARTAAHRWRGGTIRVGDNLKAKWDIEVAKVKVVRPAAALVRVGTRLRSKGKVSVKDVDIDEARQPVEIDDA